MDSKKEITEKQHNSLPVTHEEVRRDVQVLSRGRSLASSSEKDKTQVLEVLKKMKKQKRKPSDQIKPESININLSCTSIHKPKVNVDLSNKTESGGNASPNEIMSNIKDMKKKKDALQPSDKNYIENKQIVKGILDKFVKNGQVGNKSKCFVKDTSLHSDTAVNTFNKIEQQMQTLPKKYVHSMEQNQQLDQATVNKYTNMLDHNLSTSKQVEIGSVHKNDATFFKVFDGNKKDVDITKKQQTPLMYKLLNQCSTIERIVENSEASAQVKGTENNIISKVTNITQIGSARDDKSSKHNVTSKSKRYIKGNEEMCKLISKLKKPREVTEQQNEDVQKLIIKLNNQTEETDSICETLKHKKKLLDKNNCSDNRKHLARTTYSRNEEQIHKNCEPSGREEMVDDKFSKLIEHTVEEESRKQKQNGITLVKIREVEDDIHSIIRRLATTTEKFDLNNDHSRINSLHQSSCFSKSNTDKEVKSMKLNMEGFQDTELTDSVPNGIANIKNSTLENASDRIFVTCFENRSKIDNTKSSKEKKITGILKGIETSSTNASLLIRFDQHEEGTNRSLNNVLKIAKENDPREEGTDGLFNNVLKIAKENELENNEQEEADPIMDVIVKTKNNSLQSLESDPIYSQNQVNSTAPKSSTKNKEGESVQASHTNIPAKKIATSLDKVIDQIQNNTLKKTLSEVEQNTVKSGKNISEDQIMNSMSLGKTCYKSKSQLGKTTFKDTFISLSHSLTNCEPNIRSESCVHSQNSKIRFNHPNHSLEDELSEKIWIPNSVFLKQNSNTSQPSQCPLSDEKDGNGKTIGNHDLSSHSFFEPESHFENPIQTSCLHGKLKELLLNQNMNSDENNNLMENCDTHNSLLLSAKNDKEANQIRTTCIIDKNEQNLIQNNMISKKIQRISRKANELLADEEINTILTKNYEQCMRSKKNNPSQTRDEAIGKLVKKIGGQKSKAKSVVKKYRKGKLKIYRLKKLKKLSKNMENVEENLNFEDVFKKLTHDFQESSRCSSPSESFVSTPSSYKSVSTLRSETLSTGSKEPGSFHRNLREGFNKISKDKSLLHIEDSSEDLNALDRDEIKMKIQDIFLQIFNDLTSGRRAALKFRRQCYENCVFKDGRLQLKPEGEALESVLSSTVTRSQMNFKLVICIMKKIQVLLETNSKLTKRELYYQLKDMINGQGIVDRAINLVSCVLNVGRWALNIIAQKGLIFGNLKIMLSSGETINCNVPGTLIPQDISDIVEVHSDAYFILVVEKEAIFQKLLEEDIPNKLTRPFIMITGKGFPDLNTQLFLRKLWIIMSIPVFILVDADPHGINIMLNYRFGSVANAHVSHHLAVPKARWLGLLPSEIQIFNVKKQAMTTNEQKMVEKLLNTPYMKDNPGIVEELKILQKNNLKAGIEGLIKTDVFLSQVYLPHKFIHCNFV
nr:unnamed protein product [Callosobruchus chinensis]